MFNAKAVSNKLQLAKEEVRDNTAAYYFTANETVKLAGDTLWGYTKAGDTVTITGVNVFVRSYYDDVYCDVNVALAEERIVYTDDSFADAVSKLLNIAVDYTEQGMQDYGLVSLEA